MKNLAGFWPRDQKYLVIINRLIMGKKDTKAALADLSNRMHEGVFYHNICNATQP